MTELIKEEPEDITEDICRIFYAISFLTKAYRDVMIMYYFEQKSGAQIAKSLNISETAVRQRLFLAKDMIRKEVQNMNEQKPVLLDKVEYEIVGTGNPAWGDPRDVCTRQMSKHILRLCKNSPKTAKQISEALCIPMPYVEEELDILTKGANGKYGLLRELNNKRYGINFILLDKNEVMKLHKIYIDRIPEIAQIIIKHFDECKDEYMSLPYVNHNVKYDYIIWQNCMGLLFDLCNMIREELEKNHFSGIKEPKRPFSVFGYEEDNRSYGCGDDRISAENICGYKKVWFENIYISSVKEHFHCGHDIANDKQLQWAIKAIHGIKADDIKEESREDVAKAVECGYLYREGDIFYTKMLVMDVGSIDSEDELFRIRKKCFVKADDIIKETADKLGEVLKELVLPYLTEEYRYANMLASLPLIDGVYNELINKSYITPAENKTGAQGIWMFVM